MEEIRIKVLDKRKKIRQLFHLTKSASVISQEAKNTLI